MVEILAMVQNAVPIVEDEDSIKAPLDCPIRTNLNSVCYSLFAC
jgi:hypothetical protein